MGIPYTVHERSLSTYGSGYSLITRGFSVKRISKLTTTSGSDDCPYTAQGKTRIKYFRCKIQGTFCNNEPEVS